VAKTSPSISDKKPGKGVKKRKEYASGVNLSPKVSEKKSTPKLMNKGRKCAIRGGIYLVYVNSKTLGPAHWKKTIGVSVRGRGHRNSCHPLVLGKFKDLHKKKKKPREKFRRTKHRSEKTLGKGGDAERQEKLRGYD